MTDLQKCLLEALDMAKEPNWDGEDALAVSPEVARNARRLAELMWSTDIQPTPNGTICFQTEYGTVEIGKTRISAYFKDKQGVVFLDGNFSTDSGSTGHLT